jgi:hypothetical protein
MEKKMTIIINERSKNTDRDYVDNKELSQLVHDYAVLLNTARENKQEEPIIPDKIGIAIMNIVKGLARRPSFSGYPFKSEMISAAIENCLRVLSNYDIEKTTRTGNPNAFGYFTQIAYYAFLREIESEKKHLNIRAAMIERSTLDDFMYFDENNAAPVELASSNFQYLESMKERHNLYAMTDRETKMFDHEQEQEDENSNS